MTDGIETSGDDFHHHLDKCRPDALVVSKPVVQDQWSLLEPHSAGKSSCSRTPCIKVSVANKCGKGRDIARIEPPGKVGDFYDFGSILGIGGFGTVSEILHAKTFEAFAGKVVTKQSLQEINDEAEQLFRRVMETFLNNEHSYVVKMLHVFEDEDNYYQVMDSCQAGTIRHFVRDHECIPWRILETFIEQMCSGLKFLHGLQMLHRDIKPDNVMLVGGRDVGDDIVSGTSKLKINIVDFDMCIFVDDEGQAVTGHIEGTPGYLAPEVLTTRSYNVGTDLFSLGCLIFFVLKREEPGTQAHFDSLPTVNLVENISSWTADTIAFCNSLAPDGTSSIPGESPTHPDGGDSTTSPDSTGQMHSAMAHVPVRLWKIMAWCVHLEPSRRPLSAEEILRSGLLPSYSRSPSQSPRVSPKRKKDKKEKSHERFSSNCSGASISDLLKLS